MTDEPKKEPERCLEHGGHGVKVKPTTCYECGVTIVTLPDLAQGALEPLANFTLDMIAIERKRAEASERQVTELLALVDVLERGLRQQSDGGPRQDEAHNQEGAGKDPQANLGDLGVAREGVHQQPHHSEHRDNEGNDHKAPDRAEAARRQPEPVRQLIEAGTWQDWKGPGWYWIDPEYLAGHHSVPRVTGPYKTEELASAEYHAYCEIMTT